MSIVTKGIGLAKKVKHHFQAEIQTRTPVYLSPVRRIQRVATEERLCAMTFDDGPCRLPPSPDVSGGEPLTLLLAQTLEKYQALGTFDVVGDTSKNYPDKAGKHGSASWGGVSYDHYPDFGKDQEGGVAHCPELVERLLQGGHEITSHTWSHVLFGPKALVYGRRHHLTGLDAVVEDLRTMHKTIEKKWGYPIALSRPPHYVDKIQGGFSTYDAYGLLRYQYLGASFDGAGWLPLGSYQEEVEATWRPLKQALLEDEDSLRGQIIFQKDGFNMARRTPIAQGLEKQLQLLTERGYRVVTVSQLLELSPFQDVLPHTPEGAGARFLLEQGWCPAYRDNTLRLEQILTRGELALLAYGWEGVSRRIELIKANRSPFQDMQAKHPYSGAAAAAVEQGGMQTVGQEFQPDKPATREEVAEVFRQKQIAVPALPQGALTHGQVFMAVKGK